MSSKLRQLLTVLTWTVLLVLLVLAGLNFARWRARQITDEKRAAGTTRLLCQGLEGYRQRTGKPPPSLDLIVDDNMIQASWLKNVTNSVSVSYDPGNDAENRPPRLTVSAGTTFISVQGPQFRYP